MGTDRLVGWFEAARVAGAHNIERPPSDDSPARELKEYMRASWRFQKMCERGDVPRADKKPGKKGQQWWLSKLMAALKGEVPPAEKRGRGRPPKKKPDSRSSANQAKATSKPAKESRGSKNLPHRKASVNAEDGAVRHA